MKTNTNILVAFLVIIVFCSWLFIALIAGASDKGQAILDDYGKHPANKEQTAKFHGALKLLTGHWNDAQKQVILSYINHPTKDLEPQIWANFSKDDAVAVFYNIGSDDISDLKTVYIAPFSKSRNMDGWTADRKARAWQQNLALGFVRYDLSPDQQSALIEYAEKLPTIENEDIELARQQVKEMDDRMAQKFARTVGRGLFATIGKDGCKPDGFVASIKEFFSPTCVCNTSTYNWSCTGSCAAASCSTDPGNCGPFYLWDCTAMCNTGYDELQ
jgi:hypothetical protein